MNSAAVHAIYGSHRKPGSHITIAVLIYIKVTQMTHGSHCRSGFVNIARFPYLAWIHIEHIVLKSSLAKHGCDGSQMWYGLFICDLVHTLRAVTHSIPGSQIAIGFIQMIRFSNLFRFRIHSII